MSLSATHREPDPIRVLHVDDEPDLADVVATFLERENDRMDVRTSTSPAEGRDILTNHDVDCIVSDYDMPRTNGIEFLEAVREEWPDLPFILYTGKGSEEVASDAISAGVTDYLQKESGTDQYTILANRIQNVVERTHAERERERMRERMELALEHTDSLIFEIDLDAEEVIRHGAFEQFFDLPADEVPTWKDYLDHAVHPADRPQFRQFYTQLIDGDRSDGRLEYRTNPEFGRVHWIEDTVSVESESTDDTRYAVGIARDITAYKEREQELRLKERRYQAVFNDPNILVGMIDTDGTVLDINDTAMEYIDVTIDEVIDSPFWETPWFDHSATVQQEVKDWIGRAASGEYVEFETDLVRPDGEPYTVEGVFRPVMNDDGEVVSLLISDRDITDRKEREQQLEQTTTVLSTLVETLPVGVLAEDESRNVLAVNERLFELFEMPEKPDEVLGANCERLAEEVSEMFTHPEGFVSRINELVATRTPVHEEEVALQDGRTFTRSHEPIELPDGAGDLWVYRDVTAKKRREERLQETSSRLEALFEQSPDMINTHDTDGTLIDPNPRLCEETGYDKAELTDMKVWELDQAIEPDEAYALWEEMDRGDRERVEGVYRRCDGSTFPVEVHIRRFDINGEDRFIAISRDITDRKERERALRQEHDRFRAVFEESFDAMVIADDDGQYIEANQRATELFGLPKDELLGQYIAEFAPEDFDFEEAWSEFQQSDSERGTFPLVRPDGTERLVEYAATSNVAPGQHLSVLRDVTERNKREREMARQNERLEEFTGIVSHDLRNPLNVAQARLELLEADCDSEHLDAIQRSHDRMEALITDLLILSQEGETAADITTVGLAEIAENCWLNVDTKNATLVTDIERPVRADESRLRQLFENLIRNSVEHGGPDVTVTIGELDGGFYVEDDGPGIPADRRDDAFDAGYSTSDAGTGFGLSIVKQVAEAHDWEIRVAEGSTGGARFEITDVEFAAR